MKATIYKAICVIVFNTDQGYISDSVMIYLVRNNSINNYMFCCGFSFIFSLIINMVFI